MCTDSEGRKLPPQQQESYYTLKEKGFSNNDYNQLDKLYNDMVEAYLLFKNASSGMELAKKMKPGSGGPVHRDQEKENIFR